MSRPRSFDKDVALQRAMELFWRHGYDATSLDDITTALGIAKPSLYAAFGNKQALFDQALQRYATAVDAKLEVALAAPVALDAVRAFLDLFVDVSEDAPSGCLVVRNALACGSPEVQTAVLERRREVARVLTQRLTRAAAEGELATDTKPAEVARWLLTLADGLGVQGATGASRAQRKRTIELALRAWPGPA